MVKTKVFLSIAYSGIKSIKIKNNLVILDYNNKSNSLKAFGLLTRELKENKERIKNNGENIKEKVVKGYF